MGDPLPWSDNFSVGHSGLDAEHRRMVSLINDAIEALGAGKSAAEVARILEALRSTSVEHIRNDNAILWELQSGEYAGLRDSPRKPEFLRVMAAAAFEEHMDEHEKLLAEFDEVRNIPPDHLGEALKSWFLNHAIKHDSHLKAIFQAM